MFEDFVLAVGIRNGSASSSRVKVSRSPGLSQLPNFSTLTVYPPGSTASWQPTPHVSTWSSRNDNSVTGDERIPSNVGEWTDYQLQLVLEQLSARDLIKGSVKNADGRTSKESEEGLLTFGDQDRLFGSSGEVEDEDSVSSLTCWDDLDET